VKRRHRGDIGDLKLDGDGDATTGWDAARRLVAL
jgi:hypothetical protein